VLSKQGVCSRTEAARWIAQGRVRVDGQVVRDPEHPIQGATAHIEVDGQALTEAQHRYLMLNKPRGLVTTARDEHGRGTVYDCLQGSGLPWLAPVGRLDKASEGLLLMSNDPQWAARITDPGTGPDKTYHVQVDRQPNQATLDAIQRGCLVDAERLGAKSVALLRTGAKTAWLEIVLDEGRNRQIRRLLAAFDINVLRLVRVRVGALELGALAKGQWRELLREEAEALATPG
jgi:23S rRNA pseudouridine2605 synthase